MNVTLRIATPDDAKSLLEIYSYYIANSVATFHEAPKTLVEYRKQIETLSATYPFFVAEADGRFLGFANAEPVRPQSGYRYSVELTIYLHPQAPKHAGIGSRLYRAVLGCLSSQGFVNAYACICSENAESIALHKYFGFEQVALCENCAFKHGRWLSTVWMRKRLNTPVVPAIEPIPFQTYQNQWKDE
ncbi:MAG: N-acetyltransferase [Clostridiales bacterium]|nr:N-acetyltransferase [Clostridiales bacterium]